MISAQIQGNNILIHLMGRRFALKVDEFKEKFGIVPCSDAEAREAILDTVGE